MPHTTLLCLSSIIRDFSNLAFDSLIKNLLPALPGEVVILGHSPPGNEVLIERLRPYCRQLIWRFTPDPVLTADELAKDCRADTIINVLRNNLLQWHWLGVCAQLKEEFEDVHGPAGLVVWSRPDLLYLWRADIPSHPQPHTLYASPHDMWRGCNDRFSAGDSGTMSQRMKIGRYFQDVWYPRLLQDPNGVLEGSGQTWNPEFVLGSYLKDRGIRVRPSYTHFCRIRQVNGLLYGLTPHRRGFRAHFGDGPMDSEDRVAERRRFEDRSLKLLTEQTRPGVIIDPRRIEHPPSQMEMLGKLLLRRNHDRRLVPLERLLELEASAP